MSSLKLHKQVGSSCAAAAAYIGPPAGPGAPRLACFVTVDAAAQRTCPATDHHNDAVDAWQAARAYMRGKHSRLGLNFKLETDLDSDAPRSRLSCHGVTCHTVHSDTHYACACRHYRNTSHISWGMISDSDIYSYTRVMTIVHHDDSDTVTVTDCRQKKVIRHIHYQ
jgi:hypothetical protein